MRFVLSFIKVLKMSRLFRQDQDQDQDFYFKTKTKTIFHVLEAPRDQDQGLETTSLHFDEKNRKPASLTDRHHPTPPIFYLIKQQILSNKTGINFS